MHIALFFSSFRVGGVERTQILLAEELIRRGIEVDLVLVSAKGPLLKNIPTKARLVNLNVGHVSHSLFPLIQYLRNSRPDALIASQTHNNCLAIIAKALSFSSCNLVITEHTDREMVISKANLKEHLISVIARWIYPAANHIIAVSEGVAKSLQTTLSVPYSKIKIIHNPVIPSHFYKLTKENVNHKWFKQTEVPIIVAVSRLEPEKDIPNLLRAFSILLCYKQAFLVIIGDGSERLDLELLSNSIGISDRLFMPGYISNPYPFMSKADLYVLSSQREGLPSTLIEALACGLPIVSTNCPSGPAEILKNGKYGKLVPVGDSDALAEAMLEALNKNNNKINAEILKKRATDFSVEKITDNLMELLK